MSSLIRHFFISLCAAGILTAYHFAFSTKEIIVTPQATPLVQTNHETPIVVRDSAENTDFTVAVIAPSMQWFTLQIRAKAVHNPIVYGIFTVAETIPASGWVLTMFRRWY